MNKQTTIPKVPKLAPRDVEKGRPAQVDFQARPDDFPVDTRDMRMMHEAGNIKQNIALCARYGVEYQDGWEYATLTEWSDVSQGFRLPSSLDEGWEVVKTIKEGQFYLLGMPRERYQAKQQREWEADRIARGGIATAIASSGEVNPSQGFGGVAKTNTSVTVAGE